MSETELQLDMDELSSAEDFLEYFAIEYSAAIVHVNRLHILQRFHDYISKQDFTLLDESQQRTAYAELLQRAYNDFVLSDAQTEKVFKVFRMNEPSVAFVPMSSIVR